MKRYYEANQRPQKHCLFWRAEGWRETHCSLHFCLCYKSLQYFSYNFSLALESGREWQCSGMTSVILAGWCKILKGTKNILMSVCQQSFGSRSSVGILILYFWNSLPKALLFQSKTKAIRLWPVIWMSKLIKGNRWKLQLQ